MRLSFAFDLKGKEITIDGVDEENLASIFPNPYFLFLATSGDYYHIKSENHSSMVLKYQIKVFTEYTTFPLG